MKNREIKFRVWTGINMEYDVVVGKLGAFYCKELDPKDSASLSPMNTIYSNDRPVMQFVGSKDKNGKEIYEGDIVKEFDEPLKIFYNSSTCSFDMEYLGGDNIEIDVLTEVEIIGNIYENPELFISE